MTLLEDQDHQLFAGLHACVHAFGTYKHIPYGVPPPREEWRPGIPVTEGSMSIVTPPGREIAYLRVGCFSQPIMHRTRIWRVSPTELVLPQSTRSHYWLLKLVNDTAAQSRLNQVLAETCYFTMVDDKYGELTPTVPMLENLNYRTALDIVTIDDQQKPLVQDAIDTIKQRAMPVSTLHKRYDWTLDSRIPSLSSTSTQANFHVTGFAGNRSLDVFTPSPTGIRSQTPKLPSMDGTEKLDVGDSSGSFYSSLHDGLDRVWRDPPVAGKESNTIGGPANVPKPLQIKTTSTASDYSKAQSGDAFTFKLNACGETFVNSTPTDETSQKIARSGFIDMSFSQKMLSSESSFLKNSQELGVSQGIKVGSNQELLSQDHFNRPNSLPLDYTKLWLSGHDLPNFPQSEFKNLTGCANTEFRIHTSQTVRETMQDVAQRAGRFLDSAFEASPTMQNEQLSDSSPPSNLSEFATPMNIFEAGLTLDDFPENEGTRYQTTDAAKNANGLIDETTQPVVPRLPPFRDASIDHTRIGSDLGVTTPMSRNQDSQHSKHNFQVYHEEFVNSPKRQSTDVLSDISPQFGHNVNVKSMDQKSGFDERTASRQKPNLFPKKREVLAPLSPRSERFSASKPLFETNQRSQSASASLISLQKMSFNDSISTHRAEGSANDTLGCPVRQRQLSSPDVARSDYSVESSIKIPFPEYPTPKQPVDSLGEKTSLVADHPTISVIKNPKDTSNQLLHGCMRTKANSPVIIHCEKRSDLPQGDMSRENCAARNDIKPGHKGCDRINGKLPLVRTVLQSMTIAPEESSSGASSINYIPQSQSMSYLSYAEARSLKHDVFGNSLLGNRMTNASRDSVAPQNAYTQSCSSLTNLEEALNLFDDEIESQMIHVQENFKSVTPMRSDRSFGRNTNELHGIFDPSSELGAEFQEVLDLSHLAREPDDTELELPAGTSIRLPRRVPPRLMDVVQKHSLFPGPLFRGREFDPRVFGTQGVYRDMARVSEYIGWQLLDKLLRHTK